MLALQRVRYRGWPIVAEMSLGPLINKRKFLSSRLQPSLLALDASNDEILPVI